MLLRKEGENYVELSAEEEASLRAKHANGEILFMMEDGFERVMSAEEESEIRAFWASNEKTNAEIPPR